ncbi:uncharacterized protein LOC128156059 [Crassostrea angulata]|uniref:uncharacterized protein LOC128156059 n=1 Tax=Magallana angulata TaxID=2784310 RepID=UPI0022B0E65F|nr:uncharacterized protein LOC128156059 [Crassostrea angulata]
MFVFQQLVGEELMEKMVSVFRVPWVSTTMAPSNGVLIALLEVTMTKRGQVFVILVLLVLSIDSMAKQCQIHANLALRDITNIQQDRRLVYFVRMVHIKISKDNSTVRTATISMTVPTGEEQIASV